MSYSNFYSRFYTGSHRVGAALRAVWHFYPSRFYLLFIFLGQILAWFQAWFIYRNLTGDLLVLHYNVDFGVDLVGDPYRIFLYPLFGLVIGLASLILAAAANRQRDFKVITHLLLGGAAVFSFLLSLALLAVYLINFF
jgi:AcrR family transcriptional regulator